MRSASSSRRVRVERGIYRQPNGKYAVCCRHAGTLRFRTVGLDLADAREQRAALIAAVESGVVPVSPRLRFDIVGGRWLERFEARVAAGERHPRTLEAHRYQLDRHLLPALTGRRVACITVDDIAQLLVDLRRKGCSAKTCASALATLQSVLRYARRHGWISDDPIDLLEPDKRPRPAPRRQRVLGRDEIQRLLEACRAPILVSRPSSAGWEDRDSGLLLALCRVQGPAGRTRSVSPWPGRQGLRVAGLAPRGRGAEPPGRAAEASRS